MRDGEMMLGLLKQAADEEHGRVTLIRTMRSGHKEYHQVELLVDAGLMAWCPDSEGPSGGYQAARVTEDGYRLLGGVADPKEGEQRRRRFLEAVGPWSPNRGNRGCRGRHARRLAA